MLQLLENQKKSVTSYIQLFKRESLLLAWQSYLVPPKDPKRAPRSDFVSAFMEVNLNITLSDVIPKWFGHEGKINITTRNMHLLKAASSVMKELFVADS